MCILKTDGANEWMKMVECEHPGCKHSDNFDPTFRDFYETEFLRTMRPSSNTTNGGREMEDGSPGQKVSSELSLINVGASQQRLSPQDSVVTNSTRNGSAGERAATNADTLMEDAHREDTYEPRSEATPTEDTHKEGRYAEDSDEGSTFEDSTAGDDSSEESSEDGSEDDSEDDSEQRDNDGYNHVESSSDEDEDDRMDVDQADH